MAEETKFSANKISLKVFRINRWDLRNPDGFKPGLIEGHTVDASFKSGFNVERKATKADIKIEITTKSSEEQEEAFCSYDLSFFYEIKNFDELVTDDEGIEGLTVNSSLLTTLASISYSTTRGVLLTHLQGTVFKSFVLPIIEPKNLLEDTKTS